MKTKEQIIDLIKNHKKYEKEFLHLAQAYLQDKAYRETADACNSAYYHQRQIEYLKEILE